MVIRKKLFIVPLLLFFFLVVILTTACTVLGVMYGASSDKDAPYRMHLMGWEADSVEYGKRVNIYTVDDSVLIGKFVGVETLNEEAYTARYDTFRERMQDQEWLPVPGEEIRLQLKKYKEPFVFKFKGFQHDYVIVKRLDNNQDRRAHVTSIECILDRNQHRLPGETINQWMSASEIPYLSQVVIQCGDDMFQIPVEKVTHIDAFNDKRVSGLLTGLTIGLIIDASLIIGTFYILMKMNTMH